MRVISAIDRPHTLGGCWCNPEEIEPGLLRHHYIEIAPDERPRMAAFSDLD